MKRLSDYSCNRVLFLSPMNPMGIGGGSFATHAFLRACSTIFNGNIDLLLADCWQDVIDNTIKYNTIYKAKRRSVICVLFSVFTGMIQRFSIPAIRLIKENKYEYVFSNGSSISGKISRLAKKEGGKIITIHHNYEPEYFADNNSWIIKLLYLPWVKRLERIAYQNSDVNLFLTQQDKEKFSSVYGSCHGVCYVIGVFEYKDYQKPVLPDRHGVCLTFVITGSLCTRQGIDGIKFFFNELYHFLPRDCKVIVAGRTPTSEVKKLCGMHNNVQLISNPNRMSDVISSGDVYICPTRLGGGLKLRVMDGLSLGLPVIAHNCSARGYDSFYGSKYFRNFSTIEEFCSGLNDILSNLSVINREDVAEAYRKLFSYESGFERMKYCLSTIKQ